MDSVLALSSRLFAVALLSHCYFAFAQSNDEFYPHDYAADPLGSAAFSSSSSAKSSEEVDESPEDSGPLNASASSTSSLGPADQFSGKPIEGLSVVVNGLDSASYENSAETLLELYNQKSVKPAQIVLIGAKISGSKKLGDYARRLALLGVSVVRAEKVPANLKISRVPAWIVSTAEGDIVLEGLKSPAKFINAKGEFVPPDDLLKAEADAPETQLGESIQ